MRSYIVFAVAIIVLTTGAYGAGGTIPGSGTLANPYLIEDLADFDEFADPNNSATYWRTDIHIKLMSNVDLNNRTYATSVIAADTYCLHYTAFDGVPFSGVFDGNGFIISNLTINTGEERHDYLGLFGKIEGSDSVVKNLGMENFTITSDYVSYYIGGLCGWNNEGDISNCYFTGSIISASRSYYLGGLCGKNEYGNITNCNSTGTVTGILYSYSIGGLCGWNAYGNILNSYSSCSVSGVNELGGLCGTNTQGSISNSYSSGFVTGRSDSECLGGLCGINSGSISMSYSSSSITAGIESEKVGGFCGENYDGSIRDCYSNGSIRVGKESDFIGGFCGLNRSDISNCYSYGIALAEKYSLSAGLCGLNSTGGIVTNCYYYFHSGSNNSLGVALDNIQMQDESNYVGFDFAGNTDDGEEEVWTILSGHLPKLSWQANEGPLPPEPLETTLLGSGYPNDPYQINSKSDLMEFHNNDKLRLGYFILKSDIDLDGEIFSTAVIDRCFTGDFDGNGHIVRNISIDAPEAYGKYFGFFGYIGSGAEIRNLNLDNFDIAIGNSSKMVGGICGYNSGNVISCFASGLVTTGNSSEYTGGLCGANSGNIIDCQVSIGVAGEHRYRKLGGLCGFNYGSITNSHASSQISVGGGSEDVGGLCGMNSWIISSCFSKGSILGGNGADYLGGLCGTNYSTINNCYSTASVTGGDESYGIGALCGMNYRGTINESYSTGSVAGGDESLGLGGLCGTYLNDSTANNCYYFLLGGPGNKMGVVLDGLQMQDANSFSGFDFADNSNDGTENNWTIESGHLPKLSWQTESGPFPSEGPQKPPIKSDSFPTLIEPFE